MDAYSNNGFGWLVLIVGVLYILQEMGTINWWNISPWGALFVLFGLKMMGCCSSGRKR